MKKTYEVPSMTVISMEIGMNCLQDQSHNWAGTNERNDLDENGKEEIKTYINNCAPIGICCYRYNPSTECDH